MTNENVKTEKSPAITVENMVKADAEKVWELWTKPEHIKNWCNASEDWHAPHAENDVRAGGRFKTTMAAKDGSFSFDFEGIYSVAKHAEALEYAMADGRHVSIQFIKQNDGTKIIETFDPETTNSLDMQRSGWQAILDNFKKYAESKSNIKP